MRRAALILVSTLLMATSSFAQTLIIPNEPPTSPSVDSRTSTSPINTSDESDTLTKPSDRPSPDQVQGITVVGD
jgi:hypothetical protein